MTYKPRPGDIGITRISGAGGAAIRLAQWANGTGWTKYQHAFQFLGKIEGATGDDWIIEAMPGGARLIRNWHTAADTVYLRCPDQYRTAVVAAALALKGTPYSAADYAAIAAHRLHVPSSHLRRFIESSGHLICSQLVDRAADRGGWHLFDDGRWDGYVTPNDLVRLYIAQRASRIVIDKDTSR
jgi:hypothetical protein